jgi:hypothetical protein
MSLFFTNIFAPYSKSEIQGPREPCGLNVTNNSWSVYPYRIKLAMYLYAHQSYNNKEELPPFLFSGKWMISGR